MDRLIFEILLLSNTLDIYYDERVCYIMTVELENSLDPAFVVNPIWWANTSKKEQQQEKIRRLLNYLNYKQEEIIWTAFKRKY